MRCPICGNEMEEGRISVNQCGGTNLYGYKFRWYKEDDCNKKFLKKPVIKPYCEYFFSLYETRKSFHTGYYCSNCNKIVAILEASLAN